MAIRFDKELNNEINKTIRNFNQKIARLEKKEKQLILPRKITKKELKAYTDRNDLKRRLKELQRYSIRNIESTVTTKTGIKLSLYELTNLKKESARIKRNLTRQINSLKIKTPKIFGKQQAVTFAQMGDTEYLNLQARRAALNKNISTLSPRELDRYRSLLLRTSQKSMYMNSVFKNNYLNMLTELGYFFGYDEKKLQKLEKRLSNLNANEFYRLFREDKSIKAVLDYYPLLTNSFQFIKPEDVQEDIAMLYDNLILNLDEILKDYA